jgi:alpha-beta hydrolase superfamily lysophospholipase
LGSWVAGLVAAHDPAVSKASLFLTAGSLADMVWTGRATRAIRESLEPGIELTDLRRAWGPLNLENYAHRLARPDLDLHVVLAKRDKVVLPELSANFMQRLKAAGARPNILELNCGHYSLAIAALHFVGRFELEADTKARPLSGFCRLLDQHA